MLGVEHRRDRLAQGGGVDRLAIAAPGGEPRPPAALDDLQVADAGPVEHAEVDGLVEAVAHPLEHRPRPLGDDLEAAMRTGTPIPAGSRCCGDERTRGSPSWSGSGRPSSSAARWRRRRRRGSSRRRGAGAGRGCRARAPPRAPRSGSRAPGSSWSHHLAARGCVLHRQCDAHGGGAVGRGAARLDLAAGHPHEVVDLDPEGAVEAPVDLRRVVHVDVGGTVPADYEQAGVALGDPQQPVLADDREAADAEPGCGGRRDQPTIAVPWAPEANRRPTE